MSQKTPRIHVIFNTESAEESKFYTDFARHFKGWVRMKKIVLTSSKDADTLQNEKELVTGAKIVMAVTSPNRNIETQEELAALSLSLEQVTFPILFQSVALEGSCLEKKTPLPTGQVPLDEVSKFNQVMVQQVIGPVQKLL